MPQLGIEAAAGFRQRAQPFHRQPVRQKLPQRIVELALFQAQTEFHQPLPIAAAVCAFGSRGRSRPRSPMMFFWMLFEPPPIISPTSYM